MMIKFFQQFRILHSEYHVKKVKTKIPLFNIISLADRKSQPPTRIKKFQRRIESVHSTLPKYLVLAVKMG